MPEGSISFHGVESLCLEPRTYSGLDWIDILLVGRGSEGKVTAFPVSDGRIKVKLPAIGTSVIWAEDRTGEIRTYADLEELVEAMLDDPGLLVRAIRVPKHGALAVDVTDDALDLLRQAQEDGRLDREHERIESAMIHGGDL